MWAKLFHKLKLLHMFYSTYVTYFLMGVAAWWLQLPLDQQSSIMESLPWLKFAGPFTGLAMFMIARGWSQPNVPSVDTTKPEN